LGEKGEEERDKEEGKQEKQRKKEEKKRKATVSDVMLASDTPSFAKGTISA
jgi:hypothetical protein